MNDVKRQLYTLRRWAWLLGLGALLGSLVGLWISSSKPIVYQANAKVLVGRNVTTDSAAVASYYELQMKKTDMELVNTAPILQELGRRLGFPVSSGAIQVQSIEGTLLFWISVTDASSQRAALSANTLVEVYRDELQALHRGKYRAAEAALEAQIAALDETIGAAQQEIERLSAGPETSELQRLRAQQAQNRQASADLAARLAEVRTERERTLPQVSVIFPAQAPNTSVPRRRPQNMLTGGLLGVMAAGLLVFILEYVDDRLKTPEDVEEALGKPVLGVIGVIGRLAPAGRRARPGDAADAAGETPAVQALRAHLDLLAGETPLQALLVTSPGRGEGKTTLAREIAHSYAQAGRRTILLDIDWRGSQHHGAEFPTLEFDPLGPLKGFAAGLPAWQTPPLIRLAACGAIADPLAWLSSTAPVELLAELRSACDCMVIDAACGLFVDPLLLAAKTDAVLLVVKSAQTHSGAAQLLAEQIERAGGRVIGVVLNAGPRRSWPYYSRYNDIIRFYH